MGVRASAHVRLLAAVGAVAVLAGLLATVQTQVAGAAPAMPRCQGRVATIVAEAGQTTIGTRGDDVIVGTAGPDVIDGRAGNDLICGFGGDDRITGGYGNDVLVGGAGDDVLDGGRGRDRLLGGRGADRLKGGPGTDVLIGGRGRDQHLGGGQQDDCGPLRGRETYRGCRGIDGSSPTPDDGGSDDPPVSEGPLEAQLRSMVEGTVLATYGAEQPWLVEAWTWIDDQGSFVVADPGPFTAGKVGVTCRGTSGLPRCEATTLTIHPDHVNDADVIIHELAHVFERTHGLAPDRGALARAQMYFLVVHGDDCHPAEVFADTMLAVTRPEAALAYYDFACPALPDGPTPTAVAVVEAMLAGTDHSWFSSTYANGTQAWAAVMAETADPYGFERWELVWNLADEFGGYCSVSNAIDTAFFGGPDTNPWSDDGCAGGPTGLTHRAKSLGEVEATYSVGLPST